MTHQRKHVRTSKYGIRFVAGNKPPSGLRDGLYYKREGDEGNWSVYYINGRGETKRVARNILQEGFARSQAQSLSRTFNSKFLGRY